MSIGGPLIDAGEAKDTGTVRPEPAFDPDEVFAELEKRQIIVREEVTEA